MSENIRREPVAVPSRDGDAVELTRGVRVVRKPIFQSARNVDGWSSKMVDSIAIAKTLGFTMFEIDVTAVKVEAAREGDLNSSLCNIYFGSVARAVVEGEEWKEDANKKLRDSHVVTVYALVIE